MTACSSGILDGIPLFEYFSRAERDAVAARGRMTDVPAGTIIMRQDEEADALYVLVEGVVRALRRDPEGVDVEVGRRGAGECFGEMALLDGGLRSATIEAVVPCRLFVLENAVFLDVVAPSAPLLGKLLREMSLKIRDVSERIARDDLELRTRAAEAEVARHRAITQAVTGLAHELNTPLGICVTTASMIDMLAAENEDLREPAKLLCENLNRAVDLVQAFTTLAALNNAEPPEDLDLAEVIEHAVALHAADHPGTTLDLRLNAGGPRPWLGCRSHLERVLFEVIANAATHAYPPGAAAPVEIEVRPDRIDNRPAWRVVIADRGAGMPEDVQNKMFDAFFTTARPRGHKGLGLTLVFNTVTGPLGGRIHIDSEPGVGTSVSVVLPQEL